MVKRLPKSSKSPKHMNHFTPDWGFLQMRHFPPEKKYFSHLSFSYFLLLNNTFLTFQLNSLINFSILNRNASLSTSFSQVATWRLNSKEVLVLAASPSSSIGEWVNVEVVMLGGGNADQAQVAGTRGEDWDEGWRTQGREKPRNRLVMMNNCRGRAPDGEPDSWAR